MIVRLSGTARLGQASSRSAGRRSSQSTLVALTSVAADAVVDRVALPGLLARVAGDLERVVAAGATDQPAEERLSCYRTVARLEQRPRRLDRVEIRPADERLVGALEHVLAAPRLAEVDRVVQ